MPGIFIPLTTNNLNPIAFMLVSNRAPKFQALRVCFLGSLLLPLFVRYAEFYDPQWLLSLYNLYCLEGGWNLWKCYNTWPKDFLKTMWCEFPVFLLLFFLIFIQGHCFHFLERERRNKHQLVASRMCPNHGSNLEPRYVLWPGNKLTTFWFMGWCSNPLIHTGQGGRCT